MLASIVNANIFKPLVSEEGRRHLKILSIAVLALSLIATAIFFSGGLGLPAGVALGINIVCWGILPSIAGLWQIYANVHDLTNDTCSNCGRHRTPSIV